MNKQAALWFDTNKDKRWRAGDLYDMPPFTALHLTVEDLQRVYGSLPATNNQVKEHLKTFSYPAIAADRALATLKRAGLVRFNHELGYWEQLP